MALSNRVAMNLQRVLSVFEIIRDRSPLSREFLWLAHGNEARAEMIGQSGSEDEAARFNPDHCVDLCTLELGGEGVDGFAKPFRMFEQRRNVVKIYAGSWKVRHFAD